MAEVNLPPVNIKYRLQSEGSSRVQQDIDATNRRLEVARARWAATEERVQAASAALEQVAGSYEQAKVAATQGAIAIHQANLRLADLRDRLIEVEQSGAVDTIEDVNDAFEEQQHELRAIQAHYGQVISAVKEYESAVQEQSVAQRQATQKERVLGQAYGSNVWQLRSYSRGLSALMQSTRGSGATLSEWESILGAAVFTSVEMINALRTMTQTKAGVEGFFASMKARLLGVGGATLGLTVALGLLTWHLRNTARRKEEVRKSAEQLAKALETQTGAVGDNTAEWARNSLEQKGSLDLMHKWGISSAELVDLINNNREALEEFKNELNELRLERAPEGQLGMFALSTKERNEIKGLLADIEKITQEVDAGNKLWQTRLQDIVMGKQAISEAEAANRAWAREMGITADSAEAIMIALREGKDVILELAQAQSSLNSDEARFNKLLQDRTELLREIRQGPRGRPTAEQAFELRAIEDQLRVLGVHLEREGADFAVSGLSEGARRALVGSRNAWAEMGKGLMEATGEGIALGAGHFEGALLRTVTNGLISAEAEIRRFLQVRNPSIRWALKIGRPLAEGIELGLVRGIGRMVEPVTKALDAAQKAISTRLSQFAVFDAEQNLRDVRREMGHFEALQAGGMGADLTPESQIGVRDAERRLLMTKFAVQAGLASEADLIIAQKELEDARNAIETVDEAVERMRLEVERAELEVTAATLGMLSSFLGLGKAGAEMTDEGRKNFLEFARAMGVPEEQLKIIKDLMEEAASFAAAGSFALPPEVGRSFGGGKKEVKEFVDEWAKLERLNTKEVIDLAKLFRMPGESAAEAVRRAIDFLDIQMQDAMATRRLELPPIEQPGNIDFVKESLAEVTSNFREISFGPSPAGIQTFASQSGTFLGQVRDRAIEFGRKLNEIVNARRNAIKLRVDLEPGKGLRIGGGGGGSIGIHFLQHGGFFDRRDPILVGESGPELLVPETGGAVVSNRDMASLVDTMSGGGGGRGGPINVHLNVVPQWPIDAFEARKIAGNIREALIDLDGEIYF